MRQLSAAIILATCFAPVHAADTPDSDLASKLGTLLQAQEVEADRIGMTVVCEAGIPGGGAPGLFDTMAHADEGTSYVQSHEDPLRRRVIVPEWARAQNLVCLD
jgi:predicted Zn-dependent protease